MYTAAQHLAVIIAFIYSGLYPPQVFPHEEDPEALAERKKNISAPASRESVSLLTVDRAVHEFRRGRMVVITAGDGRAVLALAVEALTPKLLDTLIAKAKTASNQQSGGGQGDILPELAITRRRAIRLGIGGDALGDDNSVLALSFAGAPDGEWISRLANPLFEKEDSDEANVTARVTGRFGAEAAAVELAKIARLLPAAVLVTIGEDAAFDTAGWAARADIQLVDGGDIFQHERTTARTLKRVSEAAVPLEGAENAKVLAYRPADGGVEHLAIVIGDPGREKNPALIRLHSECFTGDLLGSLRCDCGDQLRGAIAEIGKAGAGVLLYLAQEGRGIGLVNKLRAYTLQDGGLDTLDANEELGFDADERVYLPAAQMLKDLGLSKVRLLTNNPEKVTALGAFGIDVVERVAHAFPANKHNERYLEAKKAKGGHLF